MFFSEKDAQQIVSDALRKRGSKKVSGEGLSSLLGKAKSLIVNKVNRQTENIKNNIQQPEEESIESQLENTAGVGRELTEEELRKKQEEEPVKKNNLDTVVDALNKTNLRPEAKAGLLGNISVETGETFDYLEIEDKLKIGDEKGDGRGLFMFDYMKPFYQTYLDNNNLIDSPQNQIDFTLKQIYEPKTSVLGETQANKLKKILETGDTKTITKEFMEIFENPDRKKAQLDKRISDAEKLFNQKFKIKKQTGGRVEKDPYKRQPRFI